MNGGKVTGAVSKNTDYLVVGEASGSKHAKALKLKVSVLTEAEFVQLHDEIPFDKRGASPVPS